MLCSVFTCLPHPQNKPRWSQWGMRHKQFHQGVEIHTWAILLFTEEKTCYFDSLRWAGQGVGQGVPHTGLLIYSGTLQ